MAGYLTMLFGRSPDGNSVFAGRAPEEPKMPSGLTGLEVFGDEEKNESPASDFSDADSFFNLPGGQDDDEDEEDHRR